ncbi:hypothetical protein AKJ56_00310 [candidate division MSBL1 archaeon SCGC-AAA382N08]|uniref:EamA domain-containing protein n=1 Tax=candidate division MSBL1 archaeon SCGC-AAA382N08 TaxID=1698285 RepID=A0A133VQW0_9EURY|nr:hypothetical protein AKJ56_00310 [candidate division MSBL1 archaeon SCGC-AAA382N08]
MLKVIGSILAISASFFFGLRNVLVRKSTSTGDVMEATIITLAADVSIFLPTALFLEYPHFEITSVSLIAFISAGLIGPFIGLIFLYEGTKRVGASRTTPISRGSTLVSALIGIILLGEVASTIHIVGIVTLLIGIAVISYEIESEDPDSKTSNRFTTDLIYPLSAMTFFGIMYPLMKLGYSNGTSVPVGITITFSTSLIAMTLFYLVTGRSLLAPFRAKEKKIYLATGYTHSIAILLFNFSLFISPVVITVPFRSMSPITVLILSYFFLKKLEKITTKIIIGTLLAVLGGVLIGIFM